MSGPKRAPGHYRPRRSSKYYTPANPEALLYLAFIFGMYVVCKYIGGWQWMDRVAGALLASVKYFPLWN